MNIEPVWDFIRKHTARILAAAVTGAFTWYAGASVVQANGYSQFGVSLYCLALLGLCEGMALYWPFHLESAQSAFPAKNQLSWPGLVQWASGILGVVLALGSIAATDISAAAMLGVHAQGGNFSVFWSFDRVPDWAQQIVVYGLPVLAFAHTVLLAVFYVASPDAAHARSLRSIERDADHRIRQAHSKARTAQAEAEASHYEAISADAARSAGRAKAEARAQREYGAGDEPDPPHGQRNGG